MSRYRSAMGKVIDMSALISKNEKTRAVGNMNVNARGDTIDGTGKIIKPVTAKVNEKYANTVGNKSANVVRRQNDRPAPKAPPKPAPLEELTQAEQELDASFDDDTEIEQIKANELKGKK